MTTLMKCCWLNLIISKYNHGELHLYVIIKQMSDVYFNT